VEITPGFGLSDTEGALVEFLSSLRREMIVLAD